MYFYKRNSKITLTDFFVVFFILSISPVSAMTVEQAVEEALSNNPVVHQRMALESAASFEVVSAQKNLLPKAVMGYSYTGLSRDPIMKQTENTMQIAHQNQFHWEIAVVQPLFTGFARSLGLEQTKLHEQYIKDETRRAMLDLTRAVKEACYMLLFTQKTAFVAKDEVKALEAHAEDAKRLYEQGQIPKNDLLRSQVALAAAVQQAERADADVQISVLRVNTLLNRDPKTAVAMTDETVIPEKIPALDALSLKAMTNRPVLTMLKNAVSRLAVEEKLMKSPRYPHVNLVAGYVRDGDGPDTSRNDYANTENASVVLEVSWTFFQWGKTNADEAKVRQERQATLHYINETENRIRLEVKEAVLDLEVARKNIRTAETALDQAKENYRITDWQYRQQVVNSSEVLDARADLTEAEKNRYGAVYGYLSALARLDRAVATKITHNHL